ncbi:hypothetical protein Z043_113473, partial [Scleropages formosus]
ASPVVTEKFAKQLLQCKREERPGKVGFLDEPMRAHETNLEHWLNPHCYWLNPHCYPRYGYPV